MIKFKIMDRNIRGSKAYDILYINTKRFVLSISKSDGKMHFDVLIGKIRKLPLYLITFKKEFCGEKNWGSADNDKSALSISIGRGWIRIKS